MFSELKGQMRRKEFLQALGTVLAVLISYGTFGAFAGRFLYPGGEKKKMKMYLASLENLPVGKATAVSTPHGDSILLANTSEGLKAFSSRCPHLGCQVHWRGDKADFFCPCHNGVFKQDGTATEGPPAKEGKDLVPIKIKVEGKSVFAWV